MTISSSTSITDNISSLTNKNATATDQAANKAKTNYQDFLKLLTTQLQNQDPTAPTDTNQLTQQIATLSQVEQQISTNKNLEKLVSLFNATTLNSVVGYIGKQVEATGNQTVLQSSKATIVYNLEKEADSVTVQVEDSSGNVVMNGAGTKLAGRNEILWDGKDSQGNQLKDGVYTVSVTAKDAGGTAVKATTSTVGVVTSVDSNAGATSLSLGDVSVTLDKVLSVRQAI